MKGNEITDKQSEPKANRILWDFFFEIIAFVEKSLEFIDFLLIHAGASIWDRYPNDLLLNNWFFNLEGIPCQLKLVFLFVNNILPDSDLFLIFVFFDDLGGDFNVPFEGELLSVGDQVD